MYTKCIPNQSTVFLDIILKTIKRFRVASFCMCAVRMRPTGESSQIEIYTALGSATLERFSQQVSVEVSCIYYHFNFSSYAIS